MKEFKIVPIRNGTVLDHIEPGKALAVIQALGHPVPGSSKVVSLSMNLPSGRSGHKDVLKFEDIELSPDDLRKVQAISRRGTLSVIRNYDIAEKRRWGPVAP
ncbi:MAG TPA: aspartate carbamoyltransferase regulatory subunit [Candidatus Thermoplasmatota archaeon]|nr:aspartate carbamoyltransferase regulatory subunit [Candidatus Thermoplasmatota archaeon]